MTDLRPSDLDLVAAGDDHDLADLSELPQPGLSEEDYSGCRWIAGEPTPIRSGIFCCRPTRPGSSWCPEHYRIVFGRAARRREAA